MDEYTPTAKEVFDRMIESINDQVESLDRPDYADYRWLLKDFTKQQLEEVKEWVKSFEY